MRRSVRAWLMMARAQAATAAATELNKMLLRNNNSSSKSAHDDDGNDTARRPQQQPSASSSSSSSSHTRLHHYVHEQVLPLLQCTAVDRRDHVTVTRRALCRLVRDTAFAAQVLRARPSSPLVRTLVHCLAHDATLLQLLPHMSAAQACKTVMCLANVGVREQDVYAVLLTRMCGTAVALHDVSRVLCTLAERGLHDINVQLVAVLCRDVALRTAAPRTNKDTAATAVQDNSSCNNSSSDRSGCVGADAVLTQASLRDAVHALRALSRSSRAMAYTLRATHDKNNNAVCDTTATYARDMHADCVTSLCARLVDLVVAHVAQLHPADCVYAARALLYVPDQLQQLSCTMHSTDAATSARVSSHTVAFVRAADAALRGAHGSDAAVVKCDDVARALLCVLLVPHMTSRLQQQHERHGTTTTTTTLALSLTASAAAARVRDWQLSWSGLLHVLTMLQQVHLLTVCPALHHVYTHALVAALLRDEHVAQLPVRGLVRMLQSLTPQTTTTTDDTARVHNRGKRYDKDGDVTTEDAVSAAVQRIVCIIDERLTLYAGAALLPRVSNARRDAADSNSNNNNNSYKRNNSAPCHVDVGDVLRFAVLLYAHRLRACDGLVHYLAAIAASTATTTATSTTTTTEAALAVTMSVDDSVVLLRALATCAPALRVTAATSAVALVERLCCSNSSTHDEHNNDDDSDSDTHNGILPLYARDAWACARLWRSLAQLHALPSSRVMVGTLCAHTARSDVRNDSSACHCNNSNSSSNGSSSKHGNDTTTSTLQYNEPRALLVLTRALSSCVPVVARGGRDTALARMWRRGVCGTVLPRILYCTRVLAQRQRQCRDDASTSAHVRCADDNIDATTTLSWRHVCASWSACMSLIARVMAADEQLHTTTSTVSAAATTTYAAVTTAMRLHDVAAVCTRLVHEAGAVTLHMHTHTQHDSGDNDDGDDALVAWLAMLLTWEYALYDTSWRLSRMQTTTTKTTATRNDGNNSSNTAGMVEQWHVSEARDRVAVMQRDYAAMLHTPLHATGAHVSPLQLMRAVLASPQHDSSHGDGPDAAMACVRARLRKTHVAHIMAQLPYALPLVLHAGPAHECFATYAFPLLLAAQPATYEGAAAAATEQHRNHNDNNDSCDEDDEDDDVMCKAV